MDAIPVKAGAGHSTNRVPLSPKSAIPLAVALGLCGGYLDLMLMIVRKHYWNDLRYFWSGIDFPWSIPVVHASLLGALGVLVAVVAALRPKPISLRAVVWLFATLAIWSALLRTPLYGACSLILAAGLASPISRAIVVYGRHPRSLGYTLAGLLGVLIVLAALSSGRHALRERRSSTGLPAPPLGARNVLLIVWDTVRSRNLSLYGYPRNTTPNLARWARNGVTYDLTLPPASWTYPSHSSFFTGHWPYELNSACEGSLDTSVPTLAEHLTTQGYQTVGFAANTNCCSYESGLDRGFAHYEDYPLTLESLLGRTAPGSWLLKNLVHYGDFHAAKWIDLQSRDARGITDAFFGWLHGRRRDRPFFAFLNYFDAHDPYVPPPGYAGRFGFRPDSPEDYQRLLEYGRSNKRVPLRVIKMAQDCYDDCITFLDGQLGRLLAELQGQGLLDDTLVIITSDHGEAFGDHGIFLHGTSLYLDQLVVPLVIVSPDAPKGRFVDSPVSLRDLPATVVDLLGLSAGSPFPGRSLAADWHARAGEKPLDLENTPALSELARPSAFEDQPADSLSRLGVQILLVASGWHYVRDGTGVEWLYDLQRDRMERVNLADSAKSQPALVRVRSMLLNVLNENHGSIEAEKAYLEPFREWLKILVPETSHPSDLVTIREGPR